MQKVITRFPPSPTGNLHIGGARTALFNYLFTKHHGGQIHLRLENTDEERSKTEYEQNILDSLKWLGLTFDHVKDGKPFWRQSERKEIYRNYLKKLVDGGCAYVSKEDASHSPLLKGALPSSVGGILKSSGLKDSATSFRKGGIRDEVIRFKNPNKKIAFDDLIRGRIEFDTTELGDMVIAKSIEDPLYHLAVVIDDSEMCITHVIRGEDHISNTPRQILIQEALGFERPKYAHIPLILATDRSKLSKRHGAVSVTEYRDIGYLPEAFINYLALLGWNPGTEQELFSMDELIMVFDLAKVHKGGAIFNEEKLRWINKEHIKTQGGAEIVKTHIPKTLTEGKSLVQQNALSDMLFDRLSVFGDIQKELTAGELDYLITEPEYPKELLKWKKATEEPTAHLEQAILLIGAIHDDSFTKSAVKDALLPYAEENGKGNVLWPIRVALSGKEQSPDPFTIAACIGKGETRKRLKSASDML